MVMTNRISGKDFEERLRTRLTSWCDVAYDANMDHRHKIDFIVTRFHDAFFALPIGVQVTMRGEDRQKQEEFMRVHAAGRVVPRCVYLEIDPDATLDGAAAMVHVALGSLYFGAVKAEPLVGLRVCADYYEFFDLHQARKVAAATPTLTGDIYWFNAERGFGSLYCPTQREDFFVHVYQVEPRLKSVLSACVGIGYLDPPLRVTFTDGGLRIGATQPQATKIRSAV